MALFLTTFSSELKAQVQLPCAHDFRDFIISGGCEPDCECTFYINYTFSPNPYPVLYVYVNTVLTSTQPITFLTGDEVCFVLRYENGDWEECCFEEEDWCTL